MNSIQINPPPNLNAFRYIKNKNKNWRKEGIFDEDLIYLDEDGAQQQEKQMIQQLKLALYHNIAATCLKIKDHKNALLACNEAILIDPKSMKKKKFFFF